MLSARWCVALAKCGREAVEEAILEVRASHDISPLQLPESGLYLTRLNEEFSLEGTSGEGATAGAAVLLRNRSSGEEFRGGAVLLDNDGELAEIMAICDAVIRYRLPGWESLAALAAEGTAIMIEEERLRSVDEGGSRLELPEY